MYETTRSQQVGYDRYTPLTCPPPMLVESWFLSALLVHPTGVNLFAIAPLPMLDGLHPPVFPIAQRIDTDRPQPPIAPPALNRTFASANDFSEGLALVKVNDQ